MNWISASFWFLVNISCMINVQRYTEEIECISSYGKHLLGLKFKLCWMLFNGIEFYLISHWTKFYFFYEVYLRLVDYIQASLKNWTFPYSNIVDWWEFYFKYIISFLEEVNFYILWYICIKPYTGARCSVVKKFFNSKGFDEKIVNHKMHAIKIFLFLFMSPLL